MGYRFPQRRISQREPADPTALRETIQSTVEELGGQLNEHNVVANTFASDRFPSGLYYDFHYDSLSADPHIHDGAPFLPTAASANAWLVTEGGEWGAVTAANVSYNAGQHTVWALGIVNYGITTAFSDSSRAFNKPRVQFALRINGIVIEETITGTERPDEGAPRHVRPITPIQSNATVFNPPGVHDMKTLDYSTARTTGSMSWHCRSVLVQCQWAVPQGTTTVELVARRVIADDDDYTGSTSYPVYVYNRRLLAVEMKMGGTDASDGQVVPVTYPVDGDAFNASSLNTNMMDAVVSTENALGIDAIKRAGMRHENLASQSPILFAATTEITPPAPGFVTTARTYPGWGGTGVVGVGNWDIVNNGGGTNLEVSLDDGSGDWNFETHPGFMLILGNVNYIKANVGPPAFYPALYQTLGVGTLYAGGATSLAAEDQSWSDNPNSVLRPGPLYSPFDCRTDIPLFSFFDYRTSHPAAGAVDKIRALVTCDGYATSTDWAGASLLVLIFRP